MGEQTAITPATTPEQQPGALTLASIQAGLEQFAAGLPETVDNGEMGQASRHSLSLHRNSIVADELPRVLAAGGYTTDEFEKLLTTMLSIDKRIDTSNSRVFESLIHAKDSDAFKELVARQQPGGIIDQTIGRAIDKNYIDGLNNAPMYQRLAKAAEVAYPQAGPITSWRKQGKVVPGPANIESLAGNVNYERACIDLTLERGKAEPDPARRMLILRNAEKAILEDVLGMREQLSQDFRMAIDARTMKKDEEFVTLSMDKGGGIDEKAWQDAIYDLAGKARYLGMPTLERLNDKLGLVNFDRYTLIQMERARLLFSEDPAEQKARTELIERLQHGRMRLVLTEAFDHNDAFSTVVQSFDSEEMIPAEFTGPAGIYRPFVVLKRLGIKPSQFALGIHGLPGYMQGGNPWNYYEIAGRRPASAKGGFDRTVVSIEDSQVNRIYRDFMKLDPSTGERDIFLVSCYQGKGKFWKRHDSTAEHLAAQSHPRHKVAIYAGAGSINVEYHVEDGNMNYTANKGGKQYRHDATVFRNANAGRFERANRHRGNAPIGRTAVRKSVVKQLPR
ncbi:MAG TPA: hypothetical protein VLF71_06015 [Candidatus Saccharimonadales bacterium]|nr:hypothetical protein [Candidatus Saccharimonadales bacterium]